ncbi:hypothetical protein [Spirillospora sp. CA-128828]|uniref:hypothetical protein n=1 Tax=Spirillospora sp. CA-128828 TaxID=3240033 RepID=UPI003D8CF790
MTPWAAAELDPERVAAELARRFPGCCVWLGEYTGSWWAMTGDRLVEAPDPATLGRLLHELTRRAHAGRYASLQNRTAGRGAPTFPSGRALQAPDPASGAGEADRAAAPRWPAAAAARLVRGRGGVVIHSEPCDR